MANKKLPKLLTGMLVGFSIAVLLDVILTLSIWNRALCMEPLVCMEKNEYQIRMFLSALKLLGLIGIILGLIVGFIIDKIQAKKQISGSV